MLQLLSRSRLIIIPFSSDNSDFPNRTHINHFSLRSHIEFASPVKKSLLQKGINVF